MILKIDPKAEPKVIVGKNEIGTATSGDFKIYTEKRPFEGQNEDGPYEA